MISVSACVSVWGGGGEGGGGCDDLLNPEYKGLTAYLCELILLQCFLDGFLFTTLSRRYCQGPGGLPHRYLFRHSKWGLKVTLIEAVLSLCSVVTHTLKYHTTTVESCSRSGRRLQQNAFLYICFYTLGG